MGRSEGKSVQVYPPLKEIHIELHWHDLGIGSKEFANVHDLAEFLKANPILALGVGYVPKDRRRTNLTCTLPGNFFALSPGDQSLWLIGIKELLTVHQGSVQFSGRTFQNYGMFEQFLEKHRNHR